LNSLLNIEGKTLFYKELYDKGVTYLSDLVNENGRFKTIDEIWGQFNCRNNCLNYFGLILIIKSQHINFEAKTTNPRPLISGILNSKSLSKGMYQQFMPSELDFDTIKGLSKWRSELETDIYFENVFSNISKITYDYKLQNFQYKLLHRILPTNTFLVKIGIKDSDLRSFCKIATDSIMHYIWQFPKVEEFWQQVGRWSEEIFEIHLQLNIENTLFNTNTDEFPYEIINFVLLFAKHFIHCCKWSNHLPTTELLKAKLKSREKVEKYTVVITGDLIKHEEKWSKLLNNIG